MHCIVLFGNEEFAGAGVIKTCCCAKEKTHLMPLLFIPLGQWKAVEVFCEASGKPVFQSWHRWCPEQQGFTPAQLQWADTARLFPGQPFLGWRLGEGASLLSLLGTMCLCWSQLQSPCSAWKEEISIRRPLQAALGVPRPVTCPTALA